MPIHGYPGGVISSTAPTIATTGASGVWTTETQLQNSANWPSADYITRSLRFNSADSAFLGRTPASAGNRRTWTWSGWVKRSVTGIETNVFLAGPYVAAAFKNFRIRFTSGEALEVFNYDSSYQIQLISSAVYRDPSAWYHIVVAVDTTQATNTNRVKVYVNGVQVTAFGTATYPNQNLDTEINTTEAHYLGFKYGGDANGWFSGYLADVYFIDGQALTPSSFGATDPNTGEWQPQVYHGAYGTNGFFLRFADNTNTTSTTLGLDSSGNGNNWTPTGFVVSPTTSANNDSLVDVPSSYGTDTGAGGEVRGNYATLNPLKQTGATLTNGNLQFTKAAGAGSTLFTIHPTFFVSSGKWYFEVTPTAINTNGSLIGVVGADVALATYASLASMTGNIWAWRNDSYKVNNGSSSLYGNTWSTEVIGVALDMDNGKIYWSRNGTFQASGDPAAGTNAAFTNVSGSVGPLVIDQGISGTFDASINLGQRPFAYTAPSGFKALCTQNLPTPTIGATSTTQANKYFDVVLRTSNGNVGGTYSTTVNMSNGALLWDKGRSINSDHYLLDSVRGISKTLSSNTTGAEANYPNWFTNFGSSSFTTGSDDYTAGTTVVDWIWAANGSGSSNTAGSITSTVSASTTSGFSIVTYTGNGTSGATVGHGLGVAPSMIIIKNRTDSASAFWCVYHSSAYVSGADPNVLYLNSTQAQTDDTNVWGSSPSFTSTTFKLGDYNGSNGSGDSLVAYCFAPIAGYSAFGSYTGNGSSDGTFVYTGFRPRYLLMKGNVIRNWFVFDTARSTYNVLDTVIFPNDSGAESSGGYNAFDLLSNGFKVRSSDTNFNLNGTTYIYAAFAEFPFKFARAR